MATKPATSYIKTPGETHRFSTILLSGVYPHMESRRNPVRSGCEISPRVRKTACLSEVKSDAFFAKAPGGHPWIVSD